MELVEKDVDLLQLNRTGIRVIVLFSILLESPKSPEDINKAYVNNPLINESVSYDTIRNDINALRDAGCVISRATKTDNRYVLLEHPFELNLSENDVNTLNKVYNKIYSYLPFEDLFYFDEFFENIAAYTRDEKIKENLLKISKLYCIDKILLKDLLKYSKLKKQISILYKSQTGLLKEHSVIAEKVKFRHGKLYFFGFDLEYNKNIFYHVDKILKILDIKITNDQKEFKNFKAKYKILNISPEKFVVSDCEKIIKIDKNDLIIEAETENDFIMMQNVLNYGKRCVVLEPLDFRQKIIDIVKKIRMLYENEN